MYKNRSIRIGMVIFAVLAILAAMLISYIRTDYEQVIMNDMGFHVMADGQEIVFCPWKDAEEEKYYLFLPSFFHGKNQEIELSYDDSWCSIWIDGERYQSGATWQEVADEGCYQLALRNKLGQTLLESEIQVLASRQLPAMLLTVEAEEYLQSAEDISNRKSAENGNMVLLDKSGGVTLRQHLDTIKVRGNLTATLEKKPYTFTLSEPISLLGMKPAQKWNLLANATDGSFLRNKIVLDMANAAIEEYEPDGAYTEVYLNGAYQGLYLLTEVIEIAENRLDISPTEDWLVEMELDFRLEEDTPYVITDGGQIFVIKSKDWVSPQDKEAVLARLNDIESALYAKDGISQMSGKALAQLIDLQSWAQAFLIEEISGDHDVGIASQFAYMAKEESSLLYAGPVWDFDGTMGNVNTPMFTNPRALTASIEMSRPEGNANQNRWFSAMYRNPQFREVVAQQYREVFQAVLEETLDSRIDTYTEQIRAAATLDTLRWHEQCFSWMFVLPKNLQVPEEGGYARFDVLDCQVGMVREFLTAKYDFLNQLYVEGKEFRVVTQENNDPEHNADYNGTMYYWEENE